MPKAPDGKPPRASQRLPRSCTICRQRRVKCTQTIPCGPCIASRQAHRCEREIVLYKGRLAVALDNEDSAETPTDENLVRENATLKERIMQLEAALIQTRDASHYPGGSNEDPHGVSQYMTDEKIRADDFESLENTLERLHLMHTEGNDVSLDTPSDISYEALSLLPSQPASKSIVEFSLSTLGWIHCAVNSDLFYQQHDRFWDALSTGVISVLDDHAWLAVYFATLTAGIKYMDTTSCSSLFNSEPLFQTTDIHTLARRWYDRITEELHLSNFLRVPRLETVQAIAISTLSCRFFSEYETEWLLLGVAINTARCLKMHRLGREGSCPASLLKMHEWSTLIGRELGRRLWWTLVICDWLGPLTRPASISPASFECTLTTGPTDYSICSPKVLDEGIPSPVHHHIVAAKLAYIFYYFIKGNNDHPPRNIAKAVREIDSIRDNLPSHLQKTETVIQTPEHLWISFQRYMMTIGIEFSRVMLCRSMFERWITGDTNDEVAWLHEVAIDAASSIIQHVVEPVVPSVFQKSWTVLAATVSAGVFLALDLICFHRQMSDENISRHRALLTSCHAYLTQRISNENIQRTSDVLGETLHRHSTLQLPVISSTAQLQDILQEFGGPVEQGAAANASETTPLLYQGVNSFGASTFPSDSIPPLEFLDLTFLNHEEPILALNPDFDTQWISG